MSMSQVVFLVNQSINDKIVEVSNPRFKITSFDICASYIVIGSNSGTLIFLNCDNLKVQQKLLTRSGWIIQIAVAPDDAYLAYASISGIVYVIKVPDLIPNTSLHPVSSKEHQGTTVTALAWAPSGEDLYIGDNTGCLSLLHMPSNLATSFLLDLRHDLLKLDSAIFQLDAQHHYLVVSTLTKSYLCNTRLETFTQIGMKNRQGEYGGCICQIPIHKKKMSNMSGFFKLRHSELSLIDSSLDIEQGIEAISKRSAFTGAQPDEDSVFSRDNETASNIHPSSNKITDSVMTESQFLNHTTREEIRVFCSRPGSRLWECNLSGQVLATHHFKTALSISPAPVISLNPPISVNSLEACYSLWSIHSPLSLVAFQKIFRFYDEYLLTASTYGIYIIDPNNSKILLWTPIPDGVKDIKIYGCTVLILTLEGGFHKFQITTIDVAILALHANGLYELCARMCLEYTSIFFTSCLLRKFWKCIVYDLIYHLEDEALVHGIDDLGKTITSLKSKMQSNSDHLTNTNGVLSFPSQLDVNNYEAYPLSTEKESESLAFTKEGNSSSEDRTSIFSFSESQSSDSLTHSFEDGITLKASSGAFYDSSKDKTNLTGYANFEKYSGVHDMVGSIASTLVSTITSSTKSIKDTLTNPSPLHTNGHSIFQTFESPVINGELSNFYNGNPGDPSFKIQELETKNEALIVNAKSPKAKSKDIQHKSNFGVIQAKTLSSTALPTFLKQFQKSISDVRNLHLEDKETCVRGVLTKWLNEYCKVNQELVEYKESNNLNNDMCNQFYASEEFSHLISEVSFIMLKCFQYQILIVEDDFSAHSDQTPTTKYFTHDTLILDKFYADIIEKDAQLIDYSFLMNHFDSVEYHMLIHLWCSLIRKLIANKYKDDSPPEILPDLEFTRSQRVQYLKNLADTGNLEKFLTAAANIQSPSVLFDVYYFCFFVNSFKGTFSDCLNSYIYRVSQHENIVQLYAEYWSICPEMQFEILSSFNQSCMMELSCACGYPLPNSFAANQSSKFLRAMLSLPIYEPDRVCKLFESRSFYTGIFNLQCRYNLKPIEDILPSIIQSFHSPSINLIFDYLRPDQYRHIFQALARLMTNSDKTIVCFKCSSLLSIQPHLIMDEQHPTIAPSLINLNDNSECMVDSQLSAEDLTTYSTLWQFIFCHIIKRIGSMNLLQLFLDMSHFLPSPFLLKRFLAQTILCAVVEHKGASLQQVFLQFFSVWNRFFFSIKVRSALDFSATSRYVRASCHHMHSPPTVKFCPHHHEGHCCSLSHHVSPEKIRDDSTKYGSICASSCALKCPLLALPLDLRNGHRHFGSSVSAGHIPPIGPQLSSNQATPRASNHHWGVRVQLLNGVCHLCQLGLTVEVMVNAGGLTVFSCGHAYHTVCLSQFGQFCVICLGPNSSRRAV